MGLVQEAHSNDIATWTVGNVIWFLTSTGLERYSAAFEAEFVAGDVLLDLDGGDFKLMGMSFGDVKRLEMALKRFRIESAAETGTNIDNVAAVEVVEEPPAAAEESIAEGVAVEVGSDKVLEAETVVEESVAAEESIT